MTEHAFDKTIVRICEERCTTCIFSTESPITPKRREHYMEVWQRNDTFQNCHHGTSIGDSSLMCRGFYDWCKSIGWEPTILTLGEFFDRIHFVPVPALQAGEEPVQEILSDEEVTIS